MRTSTHLETELSHIDGRGYSSYRSLRGTYDFPTFQFTIDHVQVDPFAPPSKVRALVK